MKNNRALTFIILSALISALVGLASNLASNDIPDTMCCVRATRAVQKQKEGT